MSITIVQDVFGLGLTLLLVFPVPKKISSLPELPICLRLPNAIHTIQLLSLQRIPDYRNFL